MNNGQAVLVDVFLVQQLSKYLTFVHTRNFTSRKWALIERNADCLDSKACFKWFGFNLLQYLAVYAICCSQNMLYSEMTGRWPPVRIL